MSSEQTALFALFLCLAAVEASGNAVTVLTSRMVRQRQPEVPCALTLIPPLFQRADNDSAVYPPRLFVFGTTDWLDEFLQRFPSIATIYVFTTVNVSKFEDFFLAEMMPSATIVLRIAPDPNLSVPSTMRYIAWASEDFEAEDEAEADDWLSNLSLRDPCNRLFRAMYTIRPRGTTHVFSVPTFCDLAAEQPNMAKAELLGVWSPGAGWSAPHVPIFPPLCASWRPSPDGEPLLAEMFIAGKAPRVGDFTRSEAYEILRLLRDSSGLVFQTKFRSTPTTMLLMPFIAAETCRLDVLAFPKISPPVNTLSHSELSLFPWGLDQSVCVVPAAAGKPRHVLYPITAEYTPAVWAALAAVVLTVVTCLYLMRRDESVQELVLQTLSPLLGQPLRDRWTGPQIAVLGGWLLTCLVLVGAYQGQLLGFITVPPQNREINSWQDWLESDLVLLVPNHFSVSYASDVGLDGLTEDRLARSSAENHLVIVATQRNASFIISKHNLEMRFESSLPSEVVEEYLSRTHTFVVETAIPQSNFFTTKGSPFEKPLQKLLGRIRAAGALRHNPKYTKHLPQATDDVPISLINVMPVLGVYIAGNISAVFTFLLEFFLPTEKKICCKYTPREP